jgi:phage terminase large subunit-like protein
MSALSLRAESLASLPLPTRQAFLSSLSDAEAKALFHDWQFWARTEQLLPSGDWLVWLILAGRGWGKTRTGSETVRLWVREASLVNVIGATADDARDIMIEGESGILAVCPRDERPRYISSARKLLWPNGATSLIFTADEPDRLRGKQHEKLWCDELASWRYGQEAWDQAMLGLRLGTKPQAVVTTTPRPTSLVKGLRALPTTHVTGGSTYQNRANLAPTFFSQIVSRYEGTRLGRQELNAEIIEDNPDALWQRDSIEAHRVLRVPDLIRIVVAVDPPATHGGDEAGIIVAGLGTDGDFYVLDDRSRQGTPTEWAREAVTAYHAWKADRIVAETNNGGEMVEATIRTVDSDVAYTAVHASRGKVVRAEPVSALYEQGRGHHVGTFGALEDQLCQWSPKDDHSPDRLDALVWAATELVSLGGGTGGIYV